MPGLTLSLASGAAEEGFAHQNQILAAQAAMLHGERYQATALHCGPALFVGHVGYPEYPVITVEAPDALIVLEGRVYNLEAAEVAARLREIARYVFADAAKGSDLIRRWMLEAEGEYVVAMARPDRSEILVFNDPFGRLPLYEFHNETLMLLSRECKFIQRLKPEAEFDRIGWAEFLWLGYPLGQRTLFKDVRHLEGGTLLHAVTSGGRVRTEISSLHTFNFDEVDPPGRPIQSYAVELADLLRTASRNIARHPEVSKNVISLSGGKDSRAVAFALAREGIPAVAVTCLDERGKADREVPVAQELAAALKLKWHLLRTPRPSRGEMDRLARMKDGLNAVDMAYMLSFLEQIVSRWGARAVYLTGDGGDKVFPDRRYRKNIRTLEALTDAIICDQVRMPAAQAEAIMRLPQGTLDAELRRILAQYPEQVMDRRQVHYGFSERVHKWICEGEDRARFFLWQTTPFFSLSFFRAVMRVPDDLKRHNQLYRKVFSALCPQCDTIPDSNFGLPLSSPRYVAKMRLAGLAHALPGPLIGAIRRLVRGAPKYHALTNDAQKDLRDGFARGGLGQIMSAEAVGQISNRMTMPQFENFWTLVTLERLEREGRECAPASSVQ